MSYMTRSTTSAASDAWASRGKMPRPTFDRSIDRSIDEWRVHRSILVAFYSTCTDSAFVCYLRIAPTSCACGHEQRWPSRSSRGGPTAQREGSVSTSWVSLSGFTWGATPVRLENRSGCRVSEFSRKMWGIAPTATGRALDERNETSATALQDGFFN